MAMSKEKVTIAIIGRGVVGEALGKFLKVRRLQTVKYIDPAKGYEDDIDDVAAIFICVPVPTRDGHQDLSRVNIYIKRYSYHLEHVPLFIRSTVLPGTCDRLTKTRQAFTQTPTAPVIALPEFLTQRTASRDIGNQPIIAGTKTGTYINLLNKLFKYKPVIISATNEEAETIKFFHNCYGATKVTFFNILREWTDRRNLSYAKCVEGVLASGYISPVHTTVPGPDKKYGYAGKCFPDNIAALEPFLRAKDIKGSTLFKEVIALNDTYRRKK